MSRFYDAIDLEWDKNGDFVISDIGDLKSTEDDTIASMVAEVKSILMSDFYDWEKHPGYAANLRDFIGEPNTPEVAQAIEGRISTSLHINKIVDLSDIYVRVIPVGPEELLVILSLSAIPSATNSLDEVGSTTLAFTLNLSTGATFIVSQEDHDNNYVNLIPLGES